MMAKKEQVPVIRFQGFADPWEQRKFNDVFSILQNCTLSRAELSYDNGEAFNIHYGDVLIKFGEVIDAETALLPRITDDKIVASFRSSALQDGDIVIADTAEDEAVGKCAEMLNLQEKTAISGLHTIPVRPTARFATGYLGYFMNSPAFHDQLLPLMQGTKVTSVSKSALQDTVISFPSERAEQGQIGRYFMALDTLITLHQRKYDKLVAIKRSMLEKMFPREGSCFPEIRFAGFTDPWEQRKLGDLVQFSKGTGYSKGDLRESGTPIILYGRLYTKYETVISEVDTFADAKAGSVYSRGGEVIVPASGETAEDISIASVVEKSGVLLGGDLNIITPPADLDAPFLAISISNGKPHEDMAKMAQGKSVVHLHNTDLEKIDLTYPSHEEQIQISGYFGALDHLITLHQRKLEKLQAIKRSMLEKMFV